MRAPVRLGLQIPDFNFPDVSEEALFETLVEIGTTAEASGFDSIFVMDHLHQIGTMGPSTNWMLEGNTILAALAARTSALNLGLLVGGVTYRNPALLAKITTTLDVISGGRALLGLGAAWNEDEHRAYGFGFPPLRERFERLEEALQIARGMFTEERPVFEGKHYRVDGPLNYPRPIRGGIPILVGGSGERKTLRLVARYADASNFFGDAERIRHLVGVLEGHCDTVGRDPAEITKTRLGLLSIARTSEEAQRKLDRFVPASPAAEQRRRLALAGDPDTVADQAAKLLDAGLDGLIFNFPDAHDLESIALAGETLSRLVPARA